MLWIHGLTAKLLVQGRGEMAVLPGVTALLLHQSATGTWTDRNIFIQGRGEKAVRPAVTELLLHHSATDKWTHCNIFNRG